MLLSPGRRTGSTRRTVIVTIILVLLAFGLGFPSCAKIRRAAARMHCANNLKQLGLAVHHFNDVEGTFPSGTREAPDLSPAERVSFFVSLLPFIEDNDPRAILKATSHAEAAELIGTYSANGVFRCPDWVKSYRPTSSHQTAYLGPAGIGVGAPDYPVKDPRAGIWGFDRRPTFDDTKDGTNHILLFVETTAQNDVWYRGGPATVRGLDLDQQPYFGPGLQFAGTHFEERPPLLPDRAIGMNVGLADGSTRFMRHTMNPRLFEALLTMAGNEDHDGEW